MCLTLIPAQLLTSGQRAGLAHFNGGTWHKAVAVQKAGMCLTSWDASEPIRLYHYDAAGALHLVPAGRLRFSVADPAVGRRAVDFASTTRGCTGIS